MKNPAITENHLYLKTFRKGKRFSGRILSVYVLKDYGAERLRRADPLHRIRNRLGLSVTKKVGGAVVRSRVKRILREAYRAVDRETPIKTGFLVVIAARERATGYTSDKLTRELSFALGKLGMLRAQ